MTAKEQDRYLPPLAPGPHGPISQGSSAISKPRKNSTACLPCKQAKRKCSGRPVPCKACRNTDAECVFDETLDLRRKVAARRTLGELEYYRGLLHSLLELLRSSDNDKIHRVLDNIRQSVPLNTIASAVDAPATDIGDAGPDNPGSGGTVNMDDAIAQHERLCADSHSRITVEKLCDIPLVQVSARPWTTVTYDNHLVSHLISLYFTWDHPLSQIMDRGIFLDHMASGDIQSEFCNPLLVNSILALACTYSDFPEVFAVPGEMTSWGQHFLTEAEKLWSAEEGQNSLANIQALALISSVLKLQGRDNLCWLMFRQAVQLARDRGLFHGLGSKHRNRRQMSDDALQAGTATAWGLFAMNTQLSMELSNVADLPLPRVRLYPTSHPDKNILWTPYPHSNHIDYERKPSLLHYTMIGMADLSEINVQIQDLLFEKAFDLSVDEMWEAAETLYTRLGMWSRGLPSVLSSDEPQIPQIMFLHIRCRHMTILLFDFMSNEMGLRRESQHPQVERAQSIQFQAAREIADFLRIHRESYGLRQIPRQFLDPMNSSAISLLTDLDVDKSKEAFVELCRFLVTFSKRCLPAKAMLKNIELIAQRKNASFPPDALAVMDHRELESSQWL
ncbi:fungal-specific transcription factor domain-domain-containing protein [Aspergillus taichungensis]|uniref:Fungal-specific transcription factor domain-domain-containing protein n=1 Tax=Aspergillus taichungensis TaxID=482145 RepID=A0A2J5HQZ3_9EURO|nr:fungal-specific transcription factor domain-domain-containing protein [Aspergillus taichungensis]